MPVPELVFPLDVPIPGTFTAALAGLVDRGFLGSRRYAEQQWRADRVGAHPDLLEFERLLVNRFAKLGIPMFAAEVVRGGARQDVLFATGRSKARAGRSPHQFGMAVDLVHGVRGWSLSRMEWQLVGHVGSELATQKGLGVSSSLDWGGDWKFYDPAHWQISEWKSLRDEYPFNKNWKAPKNGS